MTTPELEETSGAESPTPILDRKLRNLSPQQLATILTEQDKTK